MNAYNKIRGTTEFVSQVYLDYLDSLTIEWLYNEYLAVCKNWWISQFFTSESREKRILIQGLIERTQAKPEAKVLTFQLKVEEALTA